MPELKTTGWRNDAVAKVTGRAKYTDDIQIPGMLHAVPVYSEFVHATIHEIDVTEAKKQDGIIAVLTYKDVPGSQQWGQIQKDYPYFSSDLIRSYGDVIALIVAETREQAIRAAKLVTLQATALPLQLDPEAAMQPGAPLLHAEKGTNVVVHHKVRTGDVATEWKEHGVQFEQEYSTAFIEHAYLEPECGICIPRADGVYEIYGSMQHPFSTRRFVASCLGVSLAEVEVVGTPMGGGFGGKDDTAAIVCARAALAAKITQKPVKILYDREWSFRESYKRHAYKMKYKIGLTDDGCFSAVECKIIADAGAYCSVTPWVTWRSTVQCCGAYRVQNVLCDTFGVHTNHIFTGAFRGFGSPQVNWVIEQLVEQLAEKRGEDAIAFRRRNMVKQDDTTYTLQKLNTHKVSLEQVMDKVLDEIDYYNKLPLCSFGDPDKDVWYGIGLAISYRGMSLGAEGKDFCAAIVNVQFDGSILLEVGVHENGQGAETAMLYTLAEELGVPVERIRYQKTSTSHIPDSGTTVASRGTIMGSSAVHDAANKVKDIFKEAISELWHCEKNELIFRDNSIFQNRTNGHKMTFLEAVQYLYQKQQYPYALGIFQAPKVSWDEETGHGDAYFTWVYGCQAVELEVNPKTGVVTLLNAVAAHDVGKAVSPIMLKGQFYGGLVMGAGYGLIESFDYKDGKPLKSNLHQYRMFRANEVPDITPIIVENNDPVSKTGAKGIGEPTLELMAPAIGNAVYRATKIRIVDLPIQSHLIEKLKGRA